MTKPIRPTPDNPNQVITDFLTAVYEEDIELIKVAFDEMTTLKDATSLIVELKQQLAAKDELIKCGMEPMHSVATHDCFQDWYQDKAKQWLADASKAVK